MSSSSYLLYVKKVVRDVVLTEPIALSRFQLTRIERACAMAGLHVLKLIPEPTAVALLYAQQQQQSVYAGYCDVSVTATAGGVLCSSTIGKEDILQNVMHHILPNLDSHFSSHGIKEIKAMCVLRIATQDAIHKLSSQNMEEFEEAAYGGGIQSLALGALENSFLVGDNGVQVVKNFTYES